LTFADGALTWTGTAATEAVTVGPLSLDVVEIVGSANFGGDPDAAPWGVSFTADGGRIVALVDAEGLRLTLDDLPVTGADPELPVAARISGTVTPVFDAAGAGTVLTAAVTLAHGSTLGPVTLAADLELDGVVDLAAAVASFAGGIAVVAQEGSDQEGQATSVVGVTADVAWGAANDGLGISASVTTGAAEPLNLTFEAASGAFGLGGPLEPGALLTALGLVSPATASSFTAGATANLSGRLVEGSAGAGLADLVGSI